MSNSFLIITYLCSITVGNSNSSMEIDYSRITQGLSAGITDNPVVNLMVGGQTESQSTMSIVYAY